MKLFVESHLPVDAQTAWSLFESEEFDRRLEEAANLRCELLSEREEDGVKIRRLRYTSKTELPGMVAKALGAKSLTYEQNNRFDRAAGRLEWEVLLPMMSDRVKASGTTTITDVPGGSRRVVDGDISVAIRLIGGQIEKAVVGEFEKSMGRAVDLVRQIAKERGLA